MRYFLKYAFGVVIFLCLLAEVCAFFVNPQLNNTPIQSINAHKTYKTAHFLKLTEILFGGYFLFLN